MRTAIIVIATILYSLGAVATYQTDRELGKAKCWKSESHNSVFSSAMTAVWWPMYATLAGIVITMSGNAHPFDCKRSRLND